MGYCLQQSVCDHAARMSKEISIVNRVDLRRIDTEIGKQKRTARRIPEPFTASQNNRIVKTMGISLIAYQLRRECKDELVNQLKIIRDNYTVNEIVDRALENREDLIGKHKISYIDFPSFNADDIVMILNKDEYAEYDKDKIGYWAIYGKEENELSHADAHISFLETKDIRQIVKEIENQGISDKEGFIKYYKQLPKKVRNSLFADWGDSGVSEEEYFWKEFEKTYKFYKDCAKNNSWVYLDYC